MKYLTTVIIFILSVVLLLYGGSLFTVFISLMGVSFLYVILRQLKKNREIPLYIEIISYIITLFIIVMKTKALDYRLLSVLFFINLFPLFLTSKTKYKLMDSLTISSLVLIIGSAFSVMLYVREKSILDVLYVLVIVFFNKLFYKLASYYIPKKTNKLGISYAGVICSTIMSTIAGSLFYYVVLNKFNSIPFILLFTLLLSLCSVFGKYIYNYVRAELKTKDLAKKFFSFSSIMDAISSLLFTFLGYIIVLTIL